MKLLIILLINILFITNILAFTLNNTVGAHFTQNDVYVDVVDNCLNIEVTAEELLGLAEKAINNYWNTVPTSRLRLKKGTIKSDPGDLFYNEAICSDETNGICTPNEVIKVENDILVACNASSAANFNGEPNVLGVTLVNNITGTSINGALFLINDSDPDPYFNRMSESEKIAFLAHEIGHAIGLGHSPVEDSLMYYQTIYNRSYLGWDDIDGISYLYPVEQPFSGCGSIKPITPPRNNIFGILLGIFIVFLFVRFIKFWRFL